MGSLNPPSVSPELQSRIDFAASRNGIDPKLLTALVWQESSFNPRAVSNKGAIGLTQIIPSKAGKDLGLSTLDLFDIDKNLDGGARYLKQRIVEWGNIHDALGAYNAGDKGYASKGAAYREGSQYADEVLARYSALNGAALSTGNIVQDTVSGIDKINDAIGIPTTGDVMDYFSGAKATIILYLLALVILATSILRY